MYSCASQVAQCWPFYCAFDPDKNAVLLSFAKPWAGGAFKDGVVNSRDLIVNVEKDRVVYFDYAPEDAELNQFFPFSSKKKEDVKKLVNLMVSYVGNCNKLWAVVKKLDNYKEPCDMNLLRSSSVFWSAEGFFNLLNPTLETSKKVYDSLKDDYEEFINGIDALLGLNLTQKGKEIAYNCLIDEGPDCIKPDKYMDLIGKLSWKLNFGIKSDKKQKVYNWLKYKYPECIKHNEGKRLIDSLRKRSDEIKELYNSLIYRIHDMHINHKQHRLYVVADRPENVYMTSNSITDKKALGLDIFTHRPTAFSLLKIGNIGESKDNQTNQTIGPMNVQATLRCSDEMFKDFMVTYHKIYHTNKDYLSYKLNPETEGVKNEKGKIVPAPIDENCEPEDEWDWSCPHSGEELDDLGKKETYKDKYTDFEVYRDLKNDPNFYLNN